MNDKMVEKIILHPETYFWRELKQALMSPLVVSKHNFQISDIDLTAEQNWPIMGSPNDNITNNGKWDFTNNGTYQKQLINYLAIVISQPEKRFLLVNNHPFIRIGKIFKDISNLYVADYSLTESELADNRRQIGFPALAGLDFFNDVAPQRVTKKSYEFSFRGSYTHGVRKKLKQLNTSSSPIEVSSLLKINTRQNVPEDYVTLIQKSHFSLVPRGHAIFSHRLLEVMKYGSIPIVIADDWVLPFSKSINWERISIRCPEADISNIPELIQTVSSEKRHDMQQEVLDTYQTYFSSFATVAHGLVNELNLIKEEVILGARLVSELNFDLEREVQFNSEMSNGVNRPYLIRFFEKKIKRFK